MLTYLNIAQIIVSLLLMALVLLQTKGSTFGMGGGSDSSVFRTRRGVEKTIFQLTIGVAVIFILLSIFSVMAARAALA